MAENTIDTTYTPVVNIPDVGSVEGIKDPYEDASSSILNTDTNVTAEYTAPTLGEEPDRANYVDDKSTVQSQLSDLLSSDSKYMKAVQQGAREEASSLGLLSSSMAVGAGEYSAIKAGLPIAQQDAETYSKAQQLQQSAANTAYTTGVEGEVSGELQKQKYGLLNQSQALQASFDLMAQGADAEAQAMLQQSSNEWDFAIQDSMKRLEYQLNNQLRTNEFDYTAAENVRTQAASLIENNQISIENMLKDPDMLELGTETLQMNINNMINMTTASIQFLYDSAKLNVDGYISGLLTDLESIIAW